VREIEDSMPVSEMGEWLLLYEQEPFGDVRADLRSAIVAHTVARAIGGNKTSRVVDFMPQFRIDVPLPPSVPPELDQSAAVRARNENAERETLRLMALFDSVTPRGSKRKIIQRRRLH
jgi:hypothetical protein